MPKQTALEWLLYKLDYINISIDDDLIIEAKKLEKDQIIDAFINGKDDFENLHGSEFYYKKYQQIL